MPRVNTSRTLRSPDVQIFRAKLTDTMRAATGDIALDTAGVRFHLFTLPPGSKLMSFSLEVITASNATGTVTADIGSATDPVMFCDGADLKTIGETSMNNDPATLMNATPIYMKVVGSTAPGTVGEIIVMVHFVQIDSACRVSAIGVDGSKFDAEVL